MRSINTLLSAAALCLALGLGAARADDAKLAVADGDFQAQKSQIIQQLNDGKTYAEISAADRAEVLQALDRMEQLLAGRSASELSESQRISLFNNQELVNVLLTRAERDSQVVCTRGRTVGTHFRATRCESLAERRQRHNVTDEVVQRLQRGITDGSGVN